MLYLRLLLKILPYKKDGDEESVEIIRRRLRNLKILLKSTLQSTFHLFWNLLLLTRLSPVTLSRFSLRRQGSVRNRQPLPAASPQSCFFLREIEFFRPDTSSRSYANGMDTLSIPSSKEKTSLPYFSTIVGTPCPLCSAYFDAIKIISRLLFTGTLVPLKKPSRDNEYGSPPYDTISILSSNIYTEGAIPSFQLLCRHAFIHASLKLGKSNNVCSLLCDPLTSTRVVLY